MSCVNRRVRRARERRLLRVIIASVQRGEREKELGVRAKKMSVGANSFLF